MAIRKITRSCPRILAPKYLELTGNLTGTDYVIEISGVSSEDVRYIIHAVIALENDI